MSYKDQILNGYFDWLYDYVCKDKAHDEISYRKLFTFLYNTEFIFSLDMDDNRAIDGINMRVEYANIMAKSDSDYNNIINILDKPCSVLEMMIALAIRCETAIMSDPRYGNRTKQWFWLMMGSLGISMMTDDIYDKNYVEKVIYKFLNRQYDFDGKGGLFYIPNSEYDLRNVEIWTQLCWYLDKF